MKDGIICQVTITTFKNAWVLNPMTQVMCQFSARKLKDEDDHIFHQNKTTGSL